MHISNTNAARPSDVCFAPLDRVVVSGLPASGTLTVTDGLGRVYFTGPADSERETAFAVGGALGKHTVALTDGRGQTIVSENFTVDAVSGVDDDTGTFKSLYALLENTMRLRYGNATDKPFDAMSGVGVIAYNGVAYKNFVVWILDHVHTAKGFKYISPHANGLVDLLKLLQREDGMIWSFIYNAAYHGAYYYSAYHPYGYAAFFGEHIAARQPVENHCEFNYVDCAHLVWQSSGDDDWMRGILDSCKRALDYSVTDPARWSEKYQLLKRAYTIDSWDFQPHDAYLVPFFLASGQMIDPDKTKFTIFYGDNTGYAQACDALAEMLAHAGDEAGAAVYRERAAGIRERLHKLAWNGRFYRHRIEEDPTVVRDFGVDESKQLTFSNCYTLNRGCTHDEAVAILKTYQTLKENLPAGSPGEFYAVYPPYEKGFDESGTNRKWQYMNGGVHGHAAGELARGAFKFGFEKYGADILRRVNEIGRKSDGVLRFAYTGAYEPEPPAQVFTPLDLSAYANMDLWNTGAEGVAPWLFDGLQNDMRHFPTGRQTFAGAPYIVADPAVNGRRAAVAVSAENDALPACVEIAVDAAAGALRLLHATGGSPESGVSGLVKLLYADGSTYVKPIVYGKLITNWWFSQLKTNADAGVAWLGEGGKSIGMGICWAEIVNPHPDKKIRAVQVTAGPDGAIYALLGLTLADRAIYHKPPYESTGGPDNWSGGLCMAALIEGLGGVTDKQTVYRHAEIAPRWVAADTEAVKMTARYAASNGYVAYQYRHLVSEQAIEMRLTGSGERADLRVLLPESATGVACVTEAGAELAFTTERVENSLYAVCAVEPWKTPLVKVAYVCNQ